MVAEIRYWDVFPKEIRGYRAAASAQNVQVQLTLCGEPEGVVFESEDAAVAQVRGGGVVTIGAKVGSTNIRVYEPAHPEEVRKVRVLVMAIAGMDIKTVGLQNGAGTDTGRYANEGHVHANNLTPGSNIKDVGTNNSPGTDDNHFARVDHIHKGLTQFGTSIQPVGLTSSPGMLDQAARVDHVHQAALAGNNIQTTGASNVAGVSQKFAREDHVHKIVWLAYSGS